MKTSARNAFKGKVAVAPVDIHALSNDIYARLRAHSNPERRRIAVTYFPTQMEVISVSVPDLRAIVRDVAKRLRDEPAEAVLRLADAVIDAGAFEGRQVAYELIYRHRGAMAALTAERVEALGRGIDNWASVDAFAGTISGPLWAKGQVDDATIARWAHSPDRWWRRAAVVSTVVLSRESKGEASARTLTICELVASDRDDMVAKALSWALRALSQFDRDAVIAFVERHASELPARVRREVATKLATGLKGKPRSAR
jgi:3-methyladenine DNA glycosylase AlkD